ncbi:MAG: alpha/beta hydrolase [Chloroflexota bacterium]|nr:alpha/beta hydrolase [Chloroflexota bacterium]
MTIENVYLQTMQPWPGLKKFGRSVSIVKDNLSIYCFDSGNTDKNGIVLIHGLGDEADTWRHVFLPLSENFHVVALDLPGFGRSDKPNMHYTPNFLMETIIHLIDQLEMKRVILMGNSLGGILSHALAVKYPERINGLILVDGALLQLKPVRDMNFALMRIPLLGEWFYTHLRKDPDAAFNSLRPVYHNLDGLASSDREFLYTRVNQRVWSDGQRRAYFSTLRKFSTWIRDYQANLPGQLAALQTPTLVIRGESDNLFPEENARGILNVQPQASYHTIKGAKHLPHQEQPTNFLSVVTHWLNEIH